MSEFELTCQNGWALWGVPLVEKLLDSLEDPSIEFTVEDRMEFHDLVEGFAKKQTYDKQEISLLCISVIENYIENKVLPSLREKRGEAMLLEFEKRWSNHDTLMRNLKYVFYHHRQNLRERSTGGCFFKTLVYDEFKGQIASAIALVIEQQREHGMLNGTFWAHVFDICNELKAGANEEGQYYDKEFLANSLAYYKAKAPQWISNRSCATYVKKARDCFMEEKDRVVRYHMFNFEKSCFKEIREVFISVNASLDIFEMGHSDCHPLLCEEKVKDSMKLMFLRIPGEMKSAAQIFQQAITDEGMKLIQEADIESNKMLFCEKLVKLHGNFMRILRDFLLNHALLLMALDEAFGFLWEKGFAGSFAAEVLATFYDSMLKSDEIKTSREEAVGEILEQAIKLVKYIGDKELFAEFYREKLGRRLLCTTNYEHERIMLMKIKQDYGQYLTYSMEMMVKGRTLDRVQHAAFVEYLGNNPDENPGVHLRMTMLNSGFWINYKPIVLNLPSEMAECVKVYSEFCKIGKQQKKLTWLYQFGVYEVVGRFENKEINMIVTTRMAAALVLFNTSNKWSCQEIMTQLNLVDLDDIVRILYSLSCGKYKILNKEPSTKTISRTDVFEVNSKFSSSLERIKIPLLAVEYEMNARENTDKNVSREFDFTILDIMRSRKILEYEQLMEECISKLHEVHMFKPKVREIKNRIDNLIAGNFIQRDGERSNKLRHVGR